MWPVCFLCALKNGENACVHAAFRQRGHHKTGRNSSISPLLCKVACQHTGLMRKTRRKNASRIDFLINAAIVYERRKGRG